LGLVDNQLAELTRRSRQRRAAEVCEARPHQDSRRLRVVSSQQERRWPSKIARRRTATRRMFALIAPQRIVSYFILIKIISGRRRAQPNATWQPALNSALCPATTKGTGIGKSSRTATRLLRAALLTRSPLRANRQTKRREKQS